MWGGKKKKVVTCYYISKENKGKFVHPNYNTDFSKGKEEVSKLKY